jgi:hypothetical protein
MFAAATLGTPEQQLWEYAVLRARLEALDVVAKQVSRPADPTVARALATGVDVKGWVEQVENKDAAAEIRAVAADRAGVSPVGDVVVEVGPFDSPDRIRERHAPLLSPATRPRPLGLRDDTRLTAALERLSERESSTLAVDVERSLEELFRNQFAPGGGLSALPDVRAALDDLRAQISDEGNLRTLRRANEAADAVEQDPLRHEVETAIEALPRLGLRLAIGLLGGFAIALTAATLTASVAPPAARYAGQPQPSASASVAVPGASAIAALRITPPPMPSILATTTRSHAPPIEPEPGTAWTPRLPWIVGAIAGLLGGLVSAHFIAHASVKPVREALRARKRAVDELWGSGGAGRNREILEREISVRGRRLRRGIAHALHLRIQHLDGIVALVNEARDEASRELASMRVKVLRPSAPMLDDDISALFGVAEPLHGHLVTPPSLIRWLTKQRKLTEPDVWARELIARSWSYDSGDAPCLDAVRVRKACEEQVESVVRSPMLFDVALSQEGARITLDFAQKVAYSLGPPVAPKGSDGFVLALADAARLAILPRSEGEGIQQALRRTSSNFQVFEMPEIGPRVVLACFWEDFSVEQLAFGARAPMGAGRA